jgi:hypothetical protein
MAPRKYKDGKRLYGHTLQHQFRLHLLKYPENPKVTSPAEDQGFNNKTVGNISYSHNNYEQLIVLAVTI